MCYIEGGQAAGSNRINPGCTDKTPPQRDSPCTINHSLVFAKRSKSWQGGVAFIDPNPTPGAKTLGRMWLITKAQLIEVMMQECNIQGEVISIDFDEAQRLGSMTIRRGSWYGQLVSLGIKDGAQIWTMTHCTSLVNEKNGPSKTYAEVIKRGLYETWGISENSAHIYIIEHSKT